VSHSLGAMPRRAAADLDRYAREWSRRGVRAWEEEWWDLPSRVGDALAPLLGAAKGSVVMQPNVTLASAVFLSALDFTPPRDRLVCTALDFPSLLYSYRGLAARGAKVDIVPSVDGLTIDEDRILSAVDATTRVVCVAHGLFRTGYVVDADAIAARARDVGAVFLLDLYQTAGTVPIDLTRIGCDAAVGGNLKWLCGGPGNAFLYVRPDRIGAFAPRLTGWQAHADPFAFDPGEIRRAEGIERFLHGTPVIPAIRAAQAGIAVVAEAGVDAIRAKSVRLTERLIAAADARGWTVRTPRDARRRGGLVTVDPAGPTDAAKIERALAERGILVDHRPGAGLRIAPHFYNTADEVDRCLDAIDEILENRSFRAEGSG
jgi:kynureninase